MLLKRLINYSSRLLQICLPPTCVLCRHPAQRAQNICYLCEQTLSSVAHSCQQCAHPLSMGHLRCGVCLQNTPPFEYTFALFPYCEPISQLILGLKFQQKLTYAQTLGELLTKQIRTNWYKDKPLPNVILPVPLHPRRLRERGFNQAVEIARPIAKALDIPVDLHGLKRTRQTTAQAELPAAARKSNVQHAFTACRDYYGQSIAVIDDVVTTGHTIRACCTELKRAGAGDIHVWCAARR